MQTLTGSSEPYATWKRRREPGPCSYWTPTEEMSMSVQENGEAAMDEAIHLATGRLSWPRSELVGDGYGTAINRCADAAVVREAHPAAEIGRLDVNGAQKIWAARPGDWQGPWFDVFDRVEAMDGRRGGRLHRSATRKARRRPLRRVISTALMAPGSRRPGLGWPRLLRLRRLQGQSK